MIRNGIKMSKKVAILQSNYIPWKGYFDLIASVDEFVLYDDMQFTRRDWRNRNQIKTPNGVQWLSVPVKSKGKYHQSIRQTEIDGFEWAEMHWKTLVLNYRRAPHFSEIAGWLEPLYLQQRHQYLTDLNRTFLQAICRYIGVTTKISDSWNYTLVDGKTERLAEICRQAGATEYISGPAAKDYVEPGEFERRGIKLTWFDYSRYPEYPQLWSDFTHGVTILDLLFNCGRQSPTFMRRIPE